MYVLARQILLLAVLLLVGGFAALAVVFHPLSTCLFVLYILGKCIRRGGRYLWVKGTARWADARDAASMLSGRGMILGRFAGIPRPPFWRSARRLLGFRRSKEACLDFLCALRLSRRSYPLIRVPEKYPHVFLAAPTGAGKGVSFLVPLHLECQDSVLTHDPKCELFQLTAEAQRRMGKKVHLLAPFSKRSGKLNPLDFIDHNSQYALDDIRDLAKAIVARSGKETEPHWNDNAEILIAAMMAFVCCYCTGSDRSLKSVRELIVNQRKRLQAIQILCDSDKWDGLLSLWGHSMTHWQEKELSGILSTANRHTQFLDTPAIRDVTSTSTVNPTELKTGKIAIYFGVPLERMDVQMGWLRMVLSTCLRLIARQGIEGNNVRVCLDECAAFGRLPILGDVADKYRGFGVRCIYVYQDMGQLKRCWEDEGVSLLSNTVQVFFSVNHPDTADYCVRRLGEATEILESGGRNRGGGYSSPQSMAEGGGSTSTSWGEDSGWAQEARPLMNAAEVLTAPERFGLCFCPSMPPVGFWLIRYYEEPKLFRRPGLIRRVFSAVRVMILSLIVVVLAVLFAFAVLTASQNSPAFQGDFRVRI